MRLLHCLVFSACLLMAAPNFVYAQQTPEQQAYQVVENWAKALDSHKVPDIVKTYALSPPNAVLFFGTKSTILATTTKEIKAYFDKLVTEDKPTVSLCEHKSIAVSNDAFLFAGFYDFTLKGQLVPARYTFLIRNLPDGWRIAHHHSAAQPEPVPCLKPR